jgi:hypothetical protein
MEPSERRDREPRECMNHQDLAKALGLPDPRQFGKDEIGYFKSLGGRVYSDGRIAGYALLYTGVRCPLCEPRAAMMDGVRETTAKYRSVPFYTAD